MVKRCRRTGDGRPTTAEQPPSHRIESKWCSGTVWRTRYPPTMGQIPVPGEGKPVMIDCTGLPLAKLPVRERARCLRSPPVRGTFATCGLRARSPPTLKPASDRARSED
jgi:hypothetical protein